MSEPIIKRDKVLDWLERNGSAEPKFLRKEFNVTSENFSAWSRADLIRQDTIESTVRITDGGAAWVRVMRRHNWRRK